MNTTSKITIAALALVVLFGSIYLVNRSPGEKALLIEEVTPLENSISNNEQGDPWVTFAAYLSAAQNNDIALIAKYSHQVSSVCLDEAKREDCFARMQTAYTVGSSFKKSDFTVKSEDNKQLILSTEPLVYEDKDVIGYSTKYLLFTKDESGTFKVAGFDPNRRWFIAKTVGSTTAELLAQVKKDMIDSDGDGAFDSFETCDLPSSIMVASCDMTDPQKKDSDGDGWWDGVEPFIIPR